MILLANENAIKIIEWPSLIKIPISDKLEIHLDYAQHDNERKLKLLGTGKWKNFNELYRQDRRCKKYYNTWKT